MNIIRDNVTLYQRICPDAKYIFKADWVPSRMRAHTHTHLWINRHKTTAGSLSTIMYRISK